MSTDPIAPHRRGVLRRGVAVLTVGLAAGGPLRAGAASKVSKAFVKYQETPNGAWRCGLCRSFIPPTGAAGEVIGTCKIVDGPITRDGWCQVFSPLKRPEGAGG